MSAKKPTLIPPDSKQCQAMKPNGYNFMTFGGAPGLVRCGNKPVTIATEVVPRDDGLRGSMSLCSECWQAMIDQCGAHHASFTPIPTTKKGTNAQ